MFISNEEAAHDCLGKQTKQNWIDNINYKITLNTFDKWKEYKNHDFHRRHGQTSIFSYTQYILHTYIIDLIYNHNNFSLSVSYVWVCR